MVESLARPDYVPVLCTHRPSLLPIEWSGEVFGDEVPLLINLGDSFVKVNLTLPFRGRRS